MKLLLPCFFSFTLFGAFAQDSLYSKVFYAPAVDINTASAHPDLGDGLLISGNTFENKGLLLSVDSLGNERWKERLSADGHTVFVSEAILTSDSSYLATGSVMDHNTSVYNAFLTKTDADGAVLWSRSLAMSGDDVKGVSVIETLDSAYVVVGTAGTNVNNYTLFFAKIDREGVLLWSNALEGAGGKDVKCLRQAADSSFYIAGNTVNSSTGGPSDAILVNVTKTGGLNWTKSYGSLPVFDMEMANDGVFLLCKHLQDQAIGLMKCDLSGANLWLKVYTDIGYQMNEAPVRMTMLSDSSFVVVQGTEYMGNTFQLDMYGGFVKARGMQLNAIDVARSKNKGVFVVGDGPLWGIKALVANDHIGIVRMDSTLEGEDCLWENTVSAVFTTNAPAADVTLTSSGSLDIDDFPMVAETLNLLDYLGCVDQLGGIDENAQALGLTVYPNSSSGIFNFTQEKQDQISIAVYTMSGQEIFNVKSTSVSTQIDLSEFSGGMYFYKATDGNKRSASGKLIVE